MTITLDEPEKYRRLVLGHQFAHEASLLAQRMRDSVVAELQKDFYRVAIFGGHLVSPESDSYAAAFEMATLLGDADIDGLYGGGPGVMAAVPTAIQGSGGTSIAISVSMGFVDQVNTGLHQIEFSSANFGERLEWFYGLAGDCVCLDGGFGTALEGAYFLQISQKAQLAHAQHDAECGSELPGRDFLYTANPWVALGHIPKVIYVGETWKPQRDQIEQFLKTGTIADADTSLAVFVDTPQQAMELLIERREAWRARVESVGREPRN